MTRLCAFAALPLALLLGACATASHMEPDIAAVEARLPAALPANVPFAPDPGQVLGGLDALLPDPVLAGHLDAVLRANRDLAGARIAADIAGARLEQAWARRLPRIGVSADAGVASFLSDIDLSDSGGLGATASYDPDLFGGIAASVRSAALREEIAELDAARLARVLLARTAQSYVQAIEADSQLALARENFDFLGETLRVSRARFEGGAIARADFALSEAEYENARASLQAQELAARAARRTLAELRGDYADAVPAIAARLPDLAAPGLGYATPRQLLGRHDVRASAAAVRAASADLDAVVAANRPGASIVAALGGGGDIGDVFDIDSYVARLTASVADTVFGGGEVAREREARLRVSDAVLRHEQILRDAYAQMAGALDRTAVLDAQLTALNRAAEAADTALELETIRYDLGEAILLDVLTVQRRVNAIQSSAIRARSQYLQAAIDAHLAVGPAPR